MRLKLNIADAFSQEKFGGNPAAIVLWQEWLDEKLMQQGERDFYIKVPFKPQKKRQFSYY